MNVSGMVHLKTVTGNRNTGVLTVTACMTVITVNAVDIMFIMEECDMRLCTIVFPENGLSRTREYTFKIPRMLDVKEGDILRSPNYQNAPMKVIKVFDCPVGEFYNGFKLKELSPSDTQVEYVIKQDFNDNQTSDNMEKRNITVSLEEARDWYNGKDQTLRRLALQAYTERELSEPRNFKEVLDSLKMTDLELNTRLTCEDTSSVLEFTREINNELTLNMKLRVIAMYFNGTWKPDMNKTKYFLARTHHSYDLPNGVKLDSDYCVGTHERVMYPGIAYFRNQEDVKKAYEMLRDELR